MADSTTYADRINQGDSLEDMLREHRDAGAQAWSPIWKKATEMQRFTNGEQWPEADTRRAEEVAKTGGRKPVLMTNDEISPVLQTFAGRQMMQRFERAYMPRHPGAARQGEIMTAVDRAMMQAADAEQVESAAFKDGPGIQGVSCIRWELDDLNERGGGLLLNDLPIWQVMADPSARRANLGDRKWHRFGSWWPQREVKERWPKKWTEVVGFVGAGRPWSGGETGESSRIPWAGMAGNKPLEPYHPKGKALWVEYEEWREVNEFYEVGRPVDETQTYALALAAAMEAEGPDAPDTLTTTEMKSRKEVNEFMDQHVAVFGEEVPKEFIVRKRKVVYKYAYICGDIVLETDDLPTGYWTMQFMTGFRFPQPAKVTWRSLVERLVDPQRWVNVWLSALIRNIQISPKGLLVVEEGVFKNRNEAMAAWSSPGGLIMVGRGKLTGGQKGFEFLSGGTQPYHAMVESLMAFSRDAIPRLAGFNPGALGQLGTDLRRISGEVVRQVQDAAMTANAEPFDNLRLHRREGGRIFLSFLRTFFEVEDIVRIVGEDVAYETVMVPAMQPVMQPVTGPDGQPIMGPDGQPQMQPATDPATGEPQMEPVIDQLTGQPLTKPAVDPATGMPMRRLMVPEKGQWREDNWKEIAVEDVVPSGDQLQVVWKALETSIQILLQPQPDTGLPLFSSEVLTEIIPGLPTQIREKMRQTIKAAKLKAQQAPPQPPPQQPPQEQAA